MIASGKEKPGIEDVSKEYEFFSYACKSVETRDVFSGDHMEKVGEISQRIAAKMGINGEKGKMINLASRLHDLGKIAIPVSILEKPGKLTAVEQETLKTHTTKGARIIGEPKNDLFFYAREIILHHHEWYNGNGYPYGLEGKTIPLYARIASVADSFDALTRDRSYRKAWDFERAAEYISRNSGLRFDPEVVKAFLLLL